MKKNLRRKVLSIVLTIVMVIGYMVPNVTIVNAESTSILPTGFTSVAIGNNDGNGSATFDSTSKTLEVQGSGNLIGKDNGAVDSYQFVSYQVNGDATIIAKLDDFDMSNAQYGQAGVFIRENNTSDNADYFGVYVEPSKDQYRYAYRDNSTGGTGAAAISGLTKESKGKYIKIEKNKTSFKYYIANDKDFIDIIASGGQTINTSATTWNLGFVVSNGSSKTPAVASFNNIIIKNESGIIYTSTDIQDENNGAEGEIPGTPEIPETPELPDYGVGTLPDGFNNSSIGNESENVYANFDENSKLFTVNGSGTYIGKDVSSTDDYQFVNYKVEGNATIVARLVDFDMTNAKYGQAGIFVRNDNSTNDADYFGVYVEPSKNQYRYAYRDNASAKSGAAQIGELNADSKNQYIKIERNGTQFKAYISEDPTFLDNNTIVKTQTVKNESNTWYVGFVVSNGGSETPAVATFDNVRIENENKLYYDSTIEKMPVDTVENVKAEAGDAKVTLSWDEVKDATSYVIKRATEKNGEYKEIAEVDSSKTTYEDLEVVNFQTYYYKIMAKNANGNAYDSKAVIVVPNNSNPDNIQYEDNAANFNMIEEPNDTVSNSVITLKGLVDKDGKITIKQNDKIKVNSIDKLKNEVFTQTLTLDLGRNTIEIYHTTEDGKTTVKTYNIVYLNNNNYDIIVDSTYNGVEGREVDGVKTYSTITEAVNSVPTKNTERVNIFVKNGVYKEKTEVKSPYISIIGEDSEKTIWTYDVSNGTINPETGVKYGTSKSASVTIKSKAVGFTAENMTIENAYEEKQIVEGDQAVALNNQADQSIFINCRFIGNQDTLLADASSSSPARQYYYKCYIEGDVDFIFGRAQAVFNDCDIASVNRNLSPKNGYITAADTWDKDAYGYVIMNSRLIGLDGIADNSVSLGRPWRPSSATDTVTPAVAYINCYMGSHIATNGWDDMGANSLASTARFSEYGSYGPGAKLSDTRPLISNSEIANYSLENVFSTSSASVNGNDAYSADWNPTEESDNININSAYKNIVNVSSVELNVSELPMNIGDTTKLIATVGPEDATDKTVIFESSNENVATVDNNGNVKAIGIGTAVITARSGSEEATCTITVKLPLVQMNTVPEITAEDVTIKLGDTFDPKDYVKAEDKEDGDLSDKVEVIENTVDTKTAGEYKVVYKVTDLQGASVTKQISVTVNPKFTLINRAPKIEASDVVITEGESFDPMLNITASDYEDGDLTEFIQVIENNVDINTVGEYKVVYKVTDLDGASSTKEIKVIVNEKVQLPEIPGVDPEEPEVPSEPEIPSEPEEPSAPEVPGKPETPEILSDNQDSSDNKDDSNSGSTILPQTGDNSILYLIALVAVSSVTLYILNKRKINN